MKKEIEGLAVPGLSSEQSYRNGVHVEHGTSGSVRLDVVVGPVEKPHMIGDLKTGRASLTSHRISEIRDHLPRASKDIDITEVRP